MAEVLSRHRASLSVVEAGPGIHFFTTPAIEGRFGTTRLPTGGLVVGRVFAQGEFHQSTAIADSNGAALAKLLWGRYVALVKGQDNEWYVLRDPSGALPCFVARIGELLCVFSDLRDFLAIWDGPLSLNWEHLCAFVRWDRMASCSTGYREISQLLPGQRMRFDAHLSTDFYWSPRQFCSTGVVESRHEAESLLRESVLTSVKAWGSCYSSILLQLSGGLDSSIVLACLAELRPQQRIVAVNHYLESAQADERRYAREVAHRLGCELIEMAAPQQSASFRQMILTEHIPSPSFHRRWSPSDDLQAAIVKDKGVEVIFSGQGGDQVFQEQVDAMAAVEFARRHPLSLQLWSIAMDVAFAANVSVWSVLADVIRYASGRRGHDPYAIIHRKAFLRESAQDFVHIRHPWTRDESLPESKRQQAWALVDCYAFHPAGYTYAEDVNPLISQPIFEASLRIPAYILSHDGVSRALVRKCFESRLPQSIFRRTAKGVTTGYHHNLMLSDLRYVRELILGGRLAQEGIVDKAYLEEMLDADRFSMHDRLWSALESLVIAETWIRHAQTHGGFREERAFNVA